MEKKKIGRGYYQKGYGKGFKKNAVVYLIDGKCYVKDKANHKVDMNPLTGDLHGYVRVNYAPYNFYQVYDNNNVDKHHIFDVKHYNEINFKRSCMIGNMGTGKTVSSKDIPIRYTEQEVLDLLEKYDREFKIDTFAYTKPANYTVMDWFTKNKKQ